jgi:basic amino acid/polyamine antiporter, APA family
VLSILLLLVGANFRQLFSLTIFAEWLFYMIAGSTIFIFRQRQPLAVRPYRMWGYPFVPIVFVAVAALLLGYTFKNDWPSSGYGLLVILAGIPVFAYFSRRRNPFAKGPENSLDL